jgi:hypothetical protein
MTARRGGVPLPTAGGELPTSEVVKIAALTSANAVFVGTVTLLTPGPPVEIVEVKLLEVSTLHVVATSRESSAARAPFAMK